MIITSCSVGFTAFAADGNKTDTNNTYWKNDTSADAAFESIETLLAMVVQIDAVKNLLQDKLGMTVTDSTTISDVVETVSPTVLKLLMGIGTLDLSVIGGPTVNLRTTKQDFLTAKLGKTEYEGNQEYYDKWYEPLDGDEDDFIDFYALYGLCVANKDADNDFGRWCAETLPRLEALYESIPAPVLKPVEETDEQKANAWIDPIVTAVNNTRIASYPTGSTKLQTKSKNSALLEELNDVEYNGKKLSAYSADEIAATDGKYYLDYYNNLLSKLGKPQITNLAELIYVHAVKFNRYGLDFEVYYDMIQKAGGTVDLSKMTGASGSSVDEITASVKDSLVAELISTKRMHSLGLTTNTDYPQNDNTALNKAKWIRGQKKVAEFAAAATFSRLFFDEPNFYVDELDSSGDIVTPYFGLVTKGLAMEAGLSVDNLEITDAQLNAMKASAIANNWSSADQLLAYLDSSDISEPAKNYIKAIASKSTDAISAYAASLAADDASAPLLDSEQQYFDKGGYAAFIDRVNAMVYSQLINDSNIIWSSKKSTICNANVTSAVNVFEFYCEYIANDPGEEPEAEDPYEPYEGPVYEYATYAIPENLYVYATNAAINSVLELLELDLIKSILDSSLTTDVDLKKTLTNVWINLYNEPAQTVFKLLPTIVVLVDELVLPLVLHEKTEEPNMIIGLLSELLMNYSQITGDTNVGLNKDLFIDLNIALPATLHWVTGDTAGAEALVDYYGDVEGINPENPEEAVIYHYDSSVPKLFDIFVLDKTLANIHSGLDIGEMIANGDPAKAQIFGELFQTLLVSLRTAVDDYLAVHREDARYALAEDPETGDMVPVPAQKGLNNLSVALPYLIDQWGKNFNTRHNVNSDWAFAYDGKIEMQAVTLGSSDNPVSVQELINTHFQTFKDLNDGGTPSQILAQFIDLLIGNWVNALLDFLNDNMMDSSVTNTFIGKIPVVQGLLEALGGFGDTSVITDALNGLFQLKRCDDASFTLTQREKTNFVGFSNETAFFLISNIMFLHKDGTMHGLIPFIKGIIDNNATKNDYNYKNVFAASAPLLAGSAKVKGSSAAGTDYDKLLTPENKEAAQKLIDMLDTLLSSLLENTTLNQFKLDSTENLLTGVVTVFAAYFGGQNTNDLLKLLNNYLFYVVGESTPDPAYRGHIGNKPTDDGDVDAKRVYTSANLSNLVIQTYSFLENLVDYFFYSKDKGILLSRDPHMLIGDALYGIISPDAVAIRLTSDYSKTAEILKKKDNQNWNSFKVQINAIDYEEGNTYNTKDFLKYGFSKGDKDGFYKALGESFNGVAALLGALLATSYQVPNPYSSFGGNLYSEVLYPVLDNLATAVGAEAPMSAADYNKAYANKNYGSTLVDGIILPVGRILGELYDKPATFIINLVKGLGGVLRDSQIKQLFAGVYGFFNSTVGTDDATAVVPPTNYYDSGLTALIREYTPTGSSALFGTIKGALTGQSILNGALSILFYSADGAAGMASQKNIAINLLNTLLKDVDLVKTLFPNGLPNADFDKLYASDTADAFLLIYGYLIDGILGMDLIQSVLSSLDPEVAKILGNINSAQLLKVIREVIANLKSPVEAFWSFSEYKGKIKNTFKYPNNLTAAEANADVAKLDKLVENVFPLLNSFGVTDIEGLPQLLNDNLYTNDIITKLAKAMYGAMSGNNIVKGILSAINIDVTPAGVARYLTDKSYGKTYTSAAKTLRKAKSWDNVNKVNWGFTDKTKNAQNGFINGLAAALRPLNNVLALLLVEADLDANNIDAGELVAAFNGQGGTTEIFTDKGENAATLDYKLKGNKLVLTIQSYNKTGSGKRTIKSELIIDFDAIAADLNELLGSSLNLNFGTNGYENAIIPILEAFKIKNLKTYKQYKKDYKKAKDNLLINILKPIGGFLDKVAAAPFDTVTGVLPNVAYFLDSNGLAQAVGNLLAPILSDKGVNGVLKKNGFDLQGLIEGITGKSLGKIVADLVGYNGKLTMNLSNLKTCNIQDIILPLVNKLLKDKFGIKLPKFTWAQLASHGTIKVVKSAARNDKGKFTTRQVDARKGEVLFAVLKYVARTLIDNANAIKKLLGGIDAIKNNKTIKNILDSIFDNIAVADPEDITGIVVYLLNGNATDKFFDYRDFKYKDSSFSFGDLDEDFCRQLAPMLDGLIGGLLEGGLTGLVEEKLYTDSLIEKAATGIYGAIEGVNVGDGNLADLLAQTDIDVTTSGVASLLTNAKYGKSYPAAASAIRSAGSWKNVKEGSLKFGVKDRDSFLHALTAVLRPLFGVLDVLLNDASLNLFNMVELPGSDGYTSTIVPLLEALGVYNIKTQYQYREDIFNEYDNVLLDILNPLWDKVEDILAAPLETVADMLPNLALFFANDGLTQILDNLLTPITALLDALRPVADLNEILPAAGLDVKKLLKDKLGITLTKFDLYDLQGTLKGVIGPEKVVPLINSILPKIEIAGAKLNLELPDIDWLELASCGELIKDQPSQVACYGSRMFVKSDQDITLITVLRYLIETINYKNNYQAIVDLVGGIDGMSDTVAQVVGEVLGMLQGDTDTVIKDLVDLLQSIAG